MTRKNLYSIFNFMLLLLYVRLVLLSASKPPIYLFYCLFSLVGASGICWFRSRKRLKKSVEDDSLKSSPWWRTYLLDLQSELADYFFPFLVIFLLRSFFFDIFLIPSASMQPTLWEGDRVIVSRISHGLQFPLNPRWRLGNHNPIRGEPVCFYPPHEKETLFVKRIIGIGGDRIRITPNDEIFIWAAGENTEDAPTYQVQWKAVEKPIKAAQTVSSDISLIEETLGEHVHYIQFVQHRQRYYNDPSKNLEAKEWVVPENHYFVMGDNRSNSVDSRIFGPVKKECLIGSPLFILSSYRTSASSWIPNVQWNRWFKEIQ